LSLWFLGKLLEPRMHWAAYLAFFVSAVTVSLLPEFLLEHYAVGISGGLCAMFGMLLPIRSRDWRVREVLTDSAVQGTIALLFVMIVVTAFGWVSIANVAHFTGLLYGYLAGEIYFGRLRDWRFARTIFLAAHLSVIFGFYAVTHPWWNGRYYWYLAYRADAAGDEEGFERDLRKAVALDPGLVVPWNMLAAREGARGDLLDGLRTALRGLRANRSNADGLEIARELYAKLAITNREADAQHIVQEVFVN